MRAPSDAGRAALVAILACAAIAGCDKPYDWPYYNNDTTDGFPPPMDPPLPGEQSVYVSDVPPPPISGGTLLVTADKKMAVAADSDRDRIAIVDLTDYGVKVVTLEKGDEPGRVAQGKGSLVHVALRRGGAVVTLDLASGDAAPIARRAVCPAPRGLAYDEAQDLLHVACAGGELVSLSSDMAAPPVRELRLERDLRDVIVEGDALLVSRFRAAELLVVSADGTVKERVRPPEYVKQIFSDPLQRAFEPSVAWRTVPLPGGGAAMVHQRALMTPIDISEDAQNTSVPYAGFDCNGTILHSAVTVMRPLPSAEHPEGQTPAPNVGGIGLAVLPVDMAVSPDGFRVAVVAAGSDFLIETPISRLQQTDALDTCQLAGDQRLVPAFGQPVAVAYDAESNLLVQMRDPPGIQRFGALTGAFIGSIEIHGDDRRDSGHDLFHGRDPESFMQATLACASCHPEGGDDGRVWSFSPIGPRRTQTVAGGVLATAPLHWDGDMADFQAIIDHVFVRRMAGMPQSPERVEVFSAWLDTIPSLPRSAPADQGAVDRGEAIFKDPNVGCAACHAGETLTNNATVDVGTGYAFQVPSLRGIGARAPYMHDGCAPTLKDRFGACGGGDKHGVTSGLSPSQVDDLVAYLETL